MKSKTYWSSEILQMLLFLTVLWVIHTERLSEAEKASQLCCNEDLPAPGAVS